MLYKFTYFTTAYLCYWFLKIFFHLRIESRKCLKRYPSFILASNHISYLDPMILAAAALPKKIGFLAKEDLFKNKFLGWFLKMLGVTPIRRGAPDISALRVALKILQNRPIAIFPQGTRSLDFSNIHSGVGFLCKKTKLPIVAARIYGSERILPPGEKFLKKGRLKVVFCPLEAIDYGEDSKVISRKIVDKIRTM